MQPFGPKRLGQATSPFFYLAPGFEPGHGRTQTRLVTGQAAADVDQFRVAVEHHHRGHRAVRAELHAGLEQVHVFAAGALGQHGLDLARRSHGQHQISDLVGRRRTGNVDHAENVFGAGQEHGRCRAGPALDALAEVFGGMHLHRPAHGQGGADAVGADHVFMPVAALDQVNALRRLQRVHVAGNFEYHAVRVGQQHHRARAGQQMR